MNLLSLSQKLKIPYVDTSHWNIPLAYDGVHFMEDGHQAFADYLKSFLS